MIDLVYILNRGSLWGDRELKYSLRSVEKHLSGFRDVYIIGTMPDFPIKDIKFIPHGDPNECKETNIYEKVLRACHEESISEDFLFFNDDHFLLADYVAELFPFLFKDDLRTSSKGLRPGNLYKQALDNTYRALQERGLPTKNFDGHFPIIYNKKFFAKEMPKFDWTMKISYVVKSLYANMRWIEGQREYDIKLGSPHTLDELRLMLRSKRMFSIGNGAYCPELLTIWEELYPKPSRWEA